jgi:ribosomal protein L7/L12
MGSVKMRSSRQDVEAVLNCFDALGDDSIVKNQVAGIVRKVVGAYVNQTSVASRFTYDESAYIKQGRKIDAIKLVRERLNLGLRDAKDYVETHPYYKTQQTQQVRTAGFDL